MAGQSSDSYSDSDGDSVDDDLLNLHSTAESEKSNHTTPGTSVELNAPLLPPPPGPLLPHTPAHVRQAPLMAQQGPTACAHAEALNIDPPRKEAFIRKYKAVVARNMQLRYGDADDTDERATKRRKIQSDACSTCCRRTDSVFVCLECEFSGCWRQRHIVNHLGESSHLFALNITTGAVYCAACKDLVYHTAFDTLRQSSSYTRAKSSSAAEAWTAAGARAPFDRRSCHVRRGFLNLGASCYLSAVLQVLLHNPLIKRWFMSDKHPNQLCPRKTCLSCEMDKLFSEVYTPSSAPLAPASFLHALWKVAASNDAVAGYAQHDAHEVMVTLLYHLHHSSSTTGPTSPLISKHTFTSSSTAAMISSPLTPHPLGCKCVVHTVLGSQMRSEVRCGRCKTVRSTLDPMLDVSLDLDPATLLAGGQHSLAACLKRYTRVEQLGPQDQVGCAKCGKMSENATRQLSFDKLPPVLCVQFKRFEHKITSTSKLDSPVRFPSTLNMEPFLSSSIKAAAQAKSDRLVDPRSKVPVPRSPSTTEKPGGSSRLYEYDLFAVINHEGQLDTGHYTSFCRGDGGDDWYLFDDDKVMPVSLGTVLKSQRTAYMCFYVKRQLEYGAATLTLPIFPTATNPLPNRLTYSVPLVHLPPRPSHLPPHPNPILRTASIGGSASPGVTSGTPQPPPRKLPPASANLPPRPSPIRA